MSAVMEEKMFRGLREVTALVFFACALFFLIALVTFNHEDGGWTHSSTTNTIANACGMLGAKLADFSLSFFGLCAYLFPAIIFWHGYLLSRNISKPQEKIFTALAWLGSIAAIISSTALLHLYVLRIGIELPRSTGGIVGEEIGGAALISLGNSGATLFLLVLLVAGITMITDLSWVKLMDIIGKYTVSCCQILFRQAFDWQAKTTLENTAGIPVVAPKKANTRKNPIIGVVPTIEKSVAKVVARVEKSSNPAKKLPPTKRYKSGETVLPSLDLLDNREIRVIGYSQADLEAMSRLVETILADFNVIVNVVDFHPGPVITRFELQPAAGVKVSRISSLSKDLARALSVTSVRIVEIIPGKTVVGLEIPNREREMVTLRELLVSPNFIKAKSLLTLAMGKDIAGAPMVADLGKMPHALVAGTTGSGKSVAINTMILSLLYKATPEQVRMIMIDPKMLELSVYEGIPHLLTPVVTDMKEASNALRWAVGEMERRYKLMSKMGVRNLAGFNTLIEEATARGESIPDPIYQILNPFAEGDIP
ncbi:MAG: DNA translocase FtsK 4TM domain-containing protein, partial [Methylococcales bacterium]